MIKSIANMIYSQSGSRMVQFAMSRQVSAHWAKIGIIIFSLLMMKFCVAAAQQKTLYSTDTRSSTDININTTTIGSLVFSHCKLSDHDRLVRRNAECAMLTVPEDYDNPGNGSLDLFIARFKSNLKKPRTDAVVFIAGGPGQASSESFLQWGNVFSKILKQRDIYLIDQRGTGNSNKLTCPQFNDQLFEFDPVNIRRLTQECLSQLPGDPRFYTTSVAVKDFENVRQALGLEAWNLYGISYGTRVALHYLRQYPESTRSVILDAVAYPELILGPAIAIESQRALTQMFERCQLSAECNEQFPGFEKNVQGLIRKLKVTPQLLIIENFATGRPAKIKFTMMHLATVLRLSLYSPATVSILPVMLHEAYANNNFAPLARQSLTIANSLNKTLSAGMHNSVVCTEDAPFFDEAGVEQNTLGNTYLGDQLLEGMKVGCAVWSKGFMDANFKQAVVSDKPVLLLSGSADPITPPEYAERAAKTLSNSRHIIMPGQGHGLAMLSCMPTIMAKFIDAASIADLDTQCLDKQKPEPFFVDFNGPLP